MVIVFGSIGIDLVTRLERLPRPGETALGARYDVYPGGKGANQALAARRAGAVTMLVGAVGDDGFAAPALALLKADGVDLAHVAAAPGETTQTAFISIDSAGENVITVATGVGLKVTAALLTPVPLHRGDVLLMQREIADREILAAQAQARAAGSLIALNAAPAGGFDPRLCDTLDLLIANEHEIADIALALGLSVSEPVAAGLAVSAARQIDVLVTLGPDGVAVCRAGTVTRVESLKITPVDTTAAGDAFCGALAAELARGADLVEATRYGAAAGALACLKPGAQPSLPRRDDIAAALARSF